MRFMQDKGQLVNFLTFTLNGQQLRARKGETILAVALREGLHIPHFCYHKYLSVVGQCRACLVEILDAGNGKSIPKLQTSCSTPAAEGMVVSSENERVDEAYKGVFEFLLKNHPLDCPVCDQGGECPLQDQSMAYAKSFSRTHEFRRIYPQKEISPYIKPEMNRCVHCTCCIRFTQEIDGGGEFGWAYRGDHTEVGIFEDLALTSIVSGNVIDICPVGALTDNKYRFTARVWEMIHTEGPCTLCSVGCRQRVWTKDGMIKRVTAGENDEVNDSWICDVGRYGWSGVHGESRIQTPMLRKGGRLQPVSWEEAIAAVAGRFSAIREESGGGAIAGLGGGWSTNESAYQFGVFLRAILGSNNVDCRIHPRDAAQSEAQRIALGGIGGHGSIEALGRAKVILLVGSDPFRENPILALQVRKAHRAGAVIVSVNPRRVDLRLYWRLHHLNPLQGEMARTLRALAKNLAGEGVFPEGEGAEAYRTALEGEEIGDLLRFAGIEAEPLAEATRGLLSAAEGGAAVLVGPAVCDEAASVEAVNLSLCIGGEIIFASATPNMQGALDMGLHPGCLPGGVPLDSAKARERCANAWGHPVGPDAGLSAEAVFDALSGGGVRAVYLFGCDPVAEHPDGDRARKALEAAEFVVLHASHANASMGCADAVLPAVTFYESEGTVTNLERRVQRLRRALPPAVEGGPKEDWKIFCDIAAGMESPMKAHSLERIRLEARSLAGDYAAAFGRLPEEGLRLARPAHGRFQARNLPNHIPVKEVLRLFLSPALPHSGSFFASANHLWDMPGPALALSPFDAAQAGIEDGDDAEIGWGGRSIRMPVVLDETLPAGMVVAPEGFLRIHGDARLNRGGDPQGRGVEISLSAPGRVGVRV